MNALNFYIIAKQAADEFLSKGVNPNDSIAKHASDQNLTPIQIQRVVELTNHEINDQLRKTSSDKTYVFPLGSVSDIMAKLANVPEQPAIPYTKIAEVVQAYNKGSGEADITKTASAMVSNYGHRQEQLEKTAKVLKTAALRKLDTISTAIEAERIGTLDKLAGDLRELVDHSKHYILQNKGSLDDLLLFAKTAEKNWDAGWDAIFKVVSEELTKLGHPFKGPLADKVTLSLDYKGRRTPVAGPRVVVINGSSPTLKYIKKVKDTVSSADRLADKRREIDNFKTTITTGVTTLNDNEAVRKYVATLHKIASDSFDDIVKTAEDASKPTGKEKARVLGGLSVGELAAHTSKSALTSAGANLLHNYTPAAHENPHAGLPQYLKGKK